MSGHDPLSHERIRMMLEARGDHGIPIPEVVASVERTLEQTSQRRHSPLPGRWWPAVAAATFASVATIGVLVAGPILTPPIRDIRIGAGDVTEPALQAGRYRTTMFDPPISFSVPAAAWAPAVDLPAELQLRRIRPGEADRPDNGALTIVRIDNVMTGGCGYKGNMPWPAGPESPQAFLTWLTGQIPLGLSAPRAVTVAGRPALEVTFRASVAFRQACDYGFLLTDVGGADSPRWVEIPVDQRQVRLQVLDIDGRPVLVMTDGGNLNWYAEAVAASDEVLVSMTFEDDR